MKAGCLTGLGVDRWLWVEVSAALQYLAPIPGILWNESVFLMADYSVTDA
jgi:hypothetical protein